MVTTAGLKLGSQNEAPSNDVPKGEIVRQNPAAEVKVEQGSTVDVTFSSGPKQIAVPKVVGGNVEEAKQTLANAGLVYRHDWFAAVLLFGYRGRHHSFEWPR